MTPEPLDPAHPPAQPGEPQAETAPAAGPPEPAPGAAAPPRPPQSAPRRLVRRSHGRMLAGVAGGIADHLGVDALLIRLAFVALVFLGGTGILLYVAGWLFIPEPDGTTVLDPETIRGLRRRHPALTVIAAAVVLAIGVGLLVDALGISHAGLVWGLLLVTVGVLLLVEESWDPFGWADRGSQPPTPPPPTPTSYAAAYAPPTPAAYAPPPPAEESPGESEAAWALLAGAEGVTPRPAPRRRSLLGVLTVAAALLAVGVGALLDNLGVVSMSVASGLSLALLIVGAGLIAGAWLGRSRALIGLGVALVPFAAAAALVPEPLNAGAGDRSVAPHTLAELNGTYQLTAGHLTVDLSAVALTGASRTVTFQVAVGKLDVVVPPDVGVDITGHVGAGELRFLGHVDSGVEIDSHVADGGSPGTGSLHLDIHSGFGQVVVVRATPPV